MAQFCQFCLPMRYKYLYILTAFFYLSATSVTAQTGASGALWCDHLNNIIRCVSMRQIYEPVGTPSADTLDIAAFAPHTRLTATDRESMQRRYKKVTYQTDLQSTSGSMAHAAIAMDQWYARFKGCLEGWDTARIANRDQKVTVQDYFLTNGEDETTVRLSIQRDAPPGLSDHVRITIY